MISCIKTLERAKSEMLLQYERILNMRLYFTQPNAIEERDKTLELINNKIIEHRELIELLKMAEHEKQIA